MLFPIGGSVWFMPRVHLRTPEVGRVLCPPGMGKLNLFDLACKGLMLEVRASGGKTEILEGIAAGDIVRSSRP